MNQTSRQQGAPAAPRPAFHALDPDAVAACLESGPAGLAGAEVSRRLASHGPNVLPAPPAASLLWVFVRQFLSPLIYILIAAAVVSLVMGERVDAAFIGGVLLLNAAIGAMQEFHAQRSAEALRRLTPRHAHVVRDGEIREVDAAEVVPGDVLVLTSGERVPADARLLQAHALQIDESMLTGESLPVDKRPEAALAEDAPLAERTNMAYAASMVAQGRGRALVVATGQETEVGRLAGSLAAEAPGEPPLVVRMRHFTQRLLAALVSVIGILGALELARGTPWQEVFPLAVALAVSAVPEGLPVALTVALAIAMNRMARRNVIVRQMVAVEALGSCTVIASDKTGTLTLNRLTATRAVLPAGAAWELAGEGTPEGGRFRPAVPEADETGFRRICEIAALCNEGELARHDGEWSGTGDTVDVALLIMAHQAGCRQGELTAAYPLVDQIPYEPELGYAASVHRGPSGLRLCVKGAPERILPMCTRVADGQDGPPLDAGALEGLVAGLAAEGFRVLAFAEAKSGEVDSPLGHADLRDMTFAGVVGLIDPLRPEARDAVAACRRAGVRVCMVTGDHPRTALAIGRELGFATGEDEVITGAALREAGDEPGALDALIAGKTLFARVEPQQKLDIVRALTRQGEYVAVTGDGVNDAPALNVAHVGVAMGQRGTDVAREAADLILADDNFASVVAGIEEGRVAYQNIRKVIFLLISTGAAEIVLFVLAMAAGLPLPLTAVQLLWLNLVTNGIQDVALAFEPAEGGEMARPPRRPREPVFNRLMVQRVGLSAVVMGALAFGVFQQLMAAGMPLVAAQGTVLLLMVLFENVQVFNSRSETRSAFRHNPLRNPLLLAGTIAAQGIHIGAMYTPGLSDVLGITPVSVELWLGLLGVALLPLIAMEAHKRWLQR